MTLALTHNDIDLTTRTLWPFEFLILYTVELNQVELSTRLEVRNVGLEMFEWNVLLHTYLFVEVRLFAMGG